MPPRASRQTEPSVNNALGGLLQAMMPRGLVRSEHIRAIVDRPGLRPDILITSQGRAPVVIEAEFEPAATVEEEARSRMGLVEAEGGRVIEAAIALRYPEEIGDAHSLRRALSSARLSYCLFTEKDNKGCLERFPESGWLEGGVEDVADVARLASVPQRAVRQAAKTLEEGIDSASKVLDEMNVLRPSVMREIAQSLGMANVPQTRRMACAIIANAFVFHERLAGRYEGITSLAAVYGDDVKDPQAATLDAWNKILDINYWAIFFIAKKILTLLDSDDGARIIQRLRSAAQSASATGVDNAHDLTGRVFQRLIADRKYLATFYTRPDAAALLARLAVAKLNGADWSSVESIRELRVGDFACGTGALLSAVYEQIAARHERAGAADSNALHKAMIEDVLYGCDVMPSAVHITGSTLSGVEPSALFDSTRLYTMPYGRMPDGSVAIGSLELLKSSSVPTLINTSDPAKRTGGAGEETVGQLLVEVPDEGYDLVIMNPPFTRPGSDWEGSGRAQDYVKQFRGLGTALVAQKEMARSLKRYAQDTCYHGYAGIASAFAALAHKKLKPGGVLALVLPLSVANGLAWKRFRELIEREYTNVTVVSIAANGQNMSFSSDTGMADCLVVARKQTSAESRNDANSFATFASIHRQPRGFPQSRSLARTLLNPGPMRYIQDGPFGGTPLIVGGDSAGELVSMPHSSDNWGAVRISDYALAQTAYALSQSRIWLPGLSPSAGLKIARLGDVGKRGMHDVNIAGSAGPFARTSPSPTSTYPAMWNHHARQESRIVCVPDVQLLAKPGMEDRANAIWAMASRCHLNRDFTFGSQPLAVAFTERESIGGRVWPNVIFSDKRFDHVFSVWGNSTLGLLAYWWHSSRQQSSKASMTVSAIDSLPVLDFRALSEEQLRTAEEIFEDFREREFKPAYLADADANRALLDRRVVCDMLGFDEGVYAAVRRLSEKWCAEPSVHGGKRRPRGAALVV